MREGHRAVWVERAMNLIRYHDEALEFISRASANLPTAAKDTEAVCLLWDEADGLDRTVSGHLATINDRLLDGRGQFDVTRGADMTYRFGAEEMLVYQCTWTLMWDGHRRIVVVLAIEPRSKSLDAWVGAVEGEGITLSVPITNLQLEDALVITYFRMTTNTTSD